MDGYYAGWDGGGTGTTIECAAPDGRILLRGRSGPLNLNGNEPATVRASIRDALTQMTALPGGPAACLGLCIACAGISNPDNTAAIDAFLTKEGYSGPHIFVGDHESAFYGALEDKPGMVLISGTGSVCLGKNSRGVSHRCGGWGHRIDDGGSGYAIGRDILSAVVMARDGRTPPTLLTDMVYSHLGITDTNELIRFVYGPATSKKDIAALAPLAVKATLQGDNAAIQIETGAADQLMLLAETTAEKLTLSHAPLALSGSILTRDFVIREMVREKARQSPHELIPCAPSGNAAHGAMLIARSHFTQSSRLPE